MAPRRTLVAMFALALCVAPCRTDAADQAGDALALCDRADSVAASERVELLERGLLLAEAAVAANPRDARAHFAVFCHLGKRLDFEGAGIANLSDIRRLRHEVDTALELDPNYVDALVAKGAFLLRLPRFLGGDSELAERCLTRALELAPQHAQGHLYLARAVAEREGHGEERIETP